ncbi:MAG: ABC transporter substrate-binding protein [Actinomycetota bacterium]
MMRRRSLITAGVAILTLALIAGACAKKTNTPTKKGTITVGVSGNFSESKIVAEMYAQVLEKAGYTVNRQLDLASRKVSDAALFAGSIDVKPEYLASEAIALDPNASVSGDPTNNSQVLTTLEAAKNVTVLTYSAAIDTNVFVVTKDTATKYSLANVSDLAKMTGGKTLASTFVFGAPPDCATNKFCQKGLKSTYGIEFKEVRSLDFGGPATVAALKNGRIQVGELFSTAVYDPSFVVLVDDKHLEAADNITPVIRTAVATDEVKSLLNAVSAKLTTDQMLALNKKVDIDHEDAAAVAKAFLQSQGLL